MVSKVKEKKERLDVLLVSQGLAVIMVSSELPEVMGMADRIIVMHEGLMVAEYQAGDATAETIVSAASGAKQEAA